MEDNNSGGVLGGAGEGQGGGQGAAGVSSGQEWAFIPEGMGGLRESYEKPEQFWADVSRLQGMDREHKTLTGKSPESFVTEEDRNVFWKALGRPDGPEGYALPESWSAEGLPEELGQAVNQVLATDRPEITKIAHEMGLTGKQAEALYNVYGRLVANTFHQEAANAVPADQVIRGLWPQDTEKHLDAARRGARHAGVGNELDADGLSQNPLVLKLSHALGEALGEGGLPGSGAPNAVLPTGEEARHEMYRLIQSDAYKNNDAATMKKLEALAARVSIK